MALALGVVPARAADFYVAPAPEGSDDNPGTEAAPFASMARAQTAAKGGDTVYFAGDTDIFPGMADLASDLDLAILPIGGWGPTLRGGHMDPTTAASSLRLLRPRTAVAVHWGTLWPMGLEASAWQTT